MNISSCLSSLLDQYGSLWSGSSVSSYMYNPNHSNLSSLYQPGQ